MHCGGRVHTHTHTCAQGMGIVLRAPDDRQCDQWMRKIIDTKNEFLDAVRQLDLEQSDREPQVLIVTARDEATLGPYECILSR